MPPTPYLPLEIWSLKSEICRLKFEIWCLNIEMWNLKSEICQSNSEIWSLKLNAINFSFQFEIRKLKLEIGDSMFVIRHVKFEVQRRIRNLMLEATPPSQIRNLIFCLLLPPPLSMSFLYLSPQNTLNSWKSLKISENLWKSLKISENLWKSLKIPENPRKPLRGCSDRNEIFCLLLPPSLPPLFASFPQNTPNSWKSLKKSQKGLKKPEKAWKSLKISESLSGGV